MWGINCRMLQTYKEQAQKLAGYVLPSLCTHRVVWSHAVFYRPIGLLKMYATRCAQETAADAVQIFGGRGITKTGMGQYIEHASPFAPCYSDNS